MPLTDAEIARRWRERHPERAKESMRRYDASHREERRLKAPYGRYHVDHVHPIAKGGSNGRENIVLACRKCNLSKRDRLPIEFAGRLL